MHYVYILRNALNGRFYIGSTNDLQNRLKKHNNGEVYSTRKYRPWEMVFSQEYGSRAEARLIEYRIKKLKRRDFIEKIVKNGKITLRAISAP